MRRESDCGRPSCLVGWVVRRPVRGFDPVSSTSADQTVESVLSRMARSPPDLLKQGEEPARGFEDPRSYHPHVRLIRQGDIDERS
jgi:hypothetical protein